MTATPTATVSTARPSHATLADRAVYLARKDKALVAIVGVQVIWLWWAFGRGWFLQADLSNLADGMGRQLNWSYLSTPLGGHFAPPGRLLYWLFDQVGRLNYPLTVTFRVGCQAVATVLLYRVLVMLVGRRPLVSGIVAIYAVNPLLLGGGAWLTSGVGLMLGQVFGLLTIAEFIRYEHSGLLRRAAFTGLLLALTVLTCDTFVVIALVPPLLAVFHLYVGPPAGRLGEFLRQWRGWLLIFVPLGGVLAALLTLGNAAGAAPLGWSDAYHLLRESWLKSLGPAWVGGPWRWYAGPNDFISYAMPPDWMVLLGQLGIAVTVVVGVQRLGMRSLSAWIMPAACSVVGILLVGYGRFSTYGTLLASTPRYLFELVALFAIAAALALAPIAATEPALATIQRSTSAALQRWVGCVAFAAIVVMSLVSGARFSIRLGDSPVQDYVESLETNARTYGSDVNIYDAAVPPSVISSYEPSHRVSDVLRLAAVPARFDDPQSEPMVVTGDGHLAKALFVAAATAGRPIDSPCGNFVHGAGTWTFPLERAVAPNEWFLRLELYESAPSDISVEVVDATGAVARPIRGGTLHVGTLEVRNLPLPLFAPTAVRVHATQASTNLCLSRVAIGGPFAAGGS